MSSKTLLSAIELGVFTELAKGPQDRESLRTRLDLHPRSARDFFDALVSLGMFTAKQRQYANTPEGDLFLDPAKSSISAAFWKWPTHASTVFGAT